MIFFEDLHYVGSKEQNYKNLVKLNDFFADLHYVGSKEQKYKNLVKFNEFFFQICTMWKV